MPSFVKTAREVLPVVPLRDMVVFPHMMAPFIVGRESSVRALEQALAQNQKRLFLVTQLDPKVDEPLAGDLHAIGVVANPCTIDIRRSKIFGNGGGGVRIVASNFTLVNDVIGLNGSGLATVGGVRILDNPPGGAAAVRFEHNTVAGNASINTAAGGVACEGLTAGLTFTNSIVYSNAGATSQVSGLCAWTYSDFPEATGATNITGVPLFIDAQGRNFKLMTSSPAINAADPASTLRDDVEGGARPLGGRADMGAYEVR